MFDLCRDACGAHLAVPQLHREQLPNLLGVVLPPRLFVGDQLQEGLLAQHAELHEFADCGHSNEPGCAIQAALASGELSPQRWRNYLKLHDEREEQAATLEARLKRKAGPKPVGKPKRGEWRRGDG